MSIFIEDRSLRDELHVLKDRREAGTRLAEKLVRYRETHAVILAIPAGGVPVAAGPYTVLFLYGLN